MKLESWIFNSIKGIPPTHQPQSDSHFDVGLCWEAVVAKFLHDIFQFEALIWELELRNFRLGSFARSLSLGI